MAVDPLDPARTGPEGAVRSVATEAASPQRAASEDANQRLAAELALTRGALAAAEQQLSELREARSAEMARLERQAYWLERGGIDLDATDEPRAPCVRSWPPWAASCASRGRLRGRR